MAPSVFVQHLDFAHQRHHIEDHKALQGIQVLGGTEFRPDAVVAILQHAAGQHVATVEHRIGAVLLGDAAFLVEDEGVAVLQQSAHARARFLELHFLSVVVVDDETDIVDHLLLHGSVSYPFQFPAIEVGAPGRSAVGFLEAVRLQVDGGLP